MIRAASLYLPALITAAFAARRGLRQRDLGAAIVSSCWNFVALAVVNTIVVRLGWWSFIPTNLLLAGIPIDLLIGWSLLWGAIPALTPWRTPTVVWIAGFAGVGLFVMPMLSSVVQLKQHWLLGVLVALGACLIPGLLLARWTVRREFLWARVVAQFLITSSGLVLLPLMLSGIRPHLVPSMVIAPFALAAVALGLWAVWEFASKGGGTLLPFDPPHRLVTTGPYAHIRNPMQISIVLVYICAAFAAADWRPLCGAYLAVLYSIAVANRHEGDQLRRRFGQAWESYREGVSAWIPFVMTDGKQLGRTRDRW